MGQKTLTTEPPNITEDVFEDFLVTDDLLVDYFNEFLNLPTFPEAIKFNKVYGIFEVVSHFPDQLEQKIKKVLREHQPSNPIYSATRGLTRPAAKKSCANINIDNNYSIMCLNQEQGVQWIKKERLPAFLQSDCYFEYRLAKLVSQVKASNTGVSLQVDPQHQPWAHKRKVVPSLTPDNENEDIMRKFFVTLGQASFTQTKEWFTIAKQSDPTTTTNSISRPIPWGQENSSTTSLHEHNSHQASPSISNTQDARLHQLTNKAWSLKSEKDRKIASRDTQEEDEYSVSIAVSPTPSPVRLYVEPKQEQLFGVEDGVKPGSNIHHSAQDPKVPVFPTIEKFAFYYVDRIMKSAVSKVNGEVLKRSADEVDVFDLSEVTIQTLQKTETSSMSSERTIEEEISGSESDSEQDLPDSMHSNQDYSHIRSRKEFEKFKAFIEGTSGEKLILLWMDIERLKAMKDMKRKQSHVNGMKKLYLVATSNHYLPAEVLMGLGLLDTNQWNENHLQRAQSGIARALLLYWGPRFCSGASAIANNVDADLRVWYDRQLRPKRDVDPFAQTVTLLPYRPKSCVPRIRTSSSAVMEKSPPSPKKIRGTSGSSQPDRLISAKLTPQKRLTRSLPSSTVHSPNTRTRPVTSFASSYRTDLKKESIGPKHRCDALDEIISRAETSSCVLWSSKMEEMLQALHLDCRAGYFFATFCEQSGNKLWENSVYFWFDLQSYHHLFYQETLQPFKLRRHSQMIFANYLSPSASMDIGVDQITRKEIYHKLNPPFEDLFDSAEEYVLTLLLSAWIQMNESDRQAYEKVELVEESRQLESANYQKLHALLQEKAARKGEDQLHKSIFVPLPDKPKDPNPWEQVPVEYRNYNLGTLLRHRMELEHFRSFLDDHFASTDLMCWIDLEHLRRLPHREKEKRLEKSKDVKNKYLNKKYFFGPNSPATRDQQEQVMLLAGGWGKILHDCLSLPALIEIQKYVRMRIEKKWLPMYLSTEEYRERQKLQSQVKDVAEDVTLQTSKKKLGVWKHLDSKWVSSSKEIIAFRKALLNPITASQFQRFISLKGDFFENGLLFWQEVQKYKDLCHSHCEDSIIQSKITAIINCFINSSIPPALQIDIPPEQAQKIMERRRDLGPYVFREAQMTIFSIMFKFWPEFCDFRSQLTDEKILPLLERKKAKRAEQMKKKMKEQERLATQLQEDSKRKGTFSDIYRDNDSAYSEKLFPGRKNQQDSKRKGPVSDLRNGNSEELFSGHETYGRNKNHQDSKRKGSFSDIYGDYSEEYGRSRNVCWSYSKYLEALEQERMLIKMQQDLEKSTESSVTSELSLYSVKSDESKRTGKTFNSSHHSAHVRRISSATRH
ncbi:regulator of G-protein signaling 22 isoform X2 [Pseudophryne corroboree]|uniref:regulator of G-protein signaling 22 isoform X2 n=1 Tax=Pseudophryne corroboree TaxID=495146 RepID=UPI003081D594